jgi:hypothetical protein
MGRKMVATSARRRLTTAVCLLASEACRTSRAAHRSSNAVKPATTCCSSRLRLDRACLAQGTKGGAGCAAQRDQESGGAVTVHFDGLAEPTSMATFP